MQIFEDFKEDLISENVISNFCRTVSDYKRIVVHVEGRLPHEIKLYLKFLGNYHFFCLFLFTSNFVLLLRTTCLQV